MEFNRLNSLIEFAEEAARLKLQPTHDVSKHEFCAFEHTFRGLPGIHFNCGSETKEVWLMVDRLPETVPSTPEDQLLQIWLETSNNPTKNPTLRESIEIETPKDHNENPPGNDRPTTLLALKDCEVKSTIQSLFSSYLFNVWLPWAEQEKKRRQTIKLYNELFNLKQQLEGALADDQIEIVWGLGMAVGKVQGRKLRHPILTLAADIQVNDKTMALEIGPRDVDEQLEIDIFISTNNPGAVDLEKTFLEYIKTKTQTLSPFERDSFEPILLAAAKHLDAEGIYWPRHTTPDDRTLPSGSKELYITDTWALIMRPRSKNIMIQDLKRFRSQLEDNDSIEIPNALRSLLVEPSIDHTDVELPRFRGLSLLPVTDHSTTSHQITQNELYFPLPFNEQQAKIIQLLECYHGVVVQGPPGTGKTHTIANVISHYLALGKRVLVTSMKEPALSVLKEKLPTGLQPLAISLLLNEQEGMKQFQQSITKISQTVPSLDRSALRNEIDDLEKQLDRLHENLAFVDRTITTLARKQLEPITLDGQKFLPQEAARKVVLGQGQFEWLPDALPIDCSPMFTHKDISKLREARVLVGENLQDLNIELPELISLPDRHELQTLHQRLHKQARLRQKIDIDAHDVVKDWKTLSTTQERDQYHFLQDLLVTHRTRHLLSNLQLRKEEVASQLASYQAPVACEMHELINNSLGQHGISETTFIEKWDVLLKKLSSILGLRHSFADILEVCEAIESSGAPLWANQLRTKAVTGAIDQSLPDNWKEAWTLRQVAVYLNGADCRKEFKRLISERQLTESALARTYQDIVVKQTWLMLADRTTPRIRSALEAFSSAIAKIGKGTGKRSSRYRRDAREAAARSNTAIPCWIMPHWKVSEALPPEYGTFDLVIIDEASQSDLSALPALLRAKKVLVVGDEKQVSPDAIGMEEEQIRTLMRRYLDQQVADFRALMSPDRSIYDLFKVVFPESTLMLKEHFRCVGPIIEYSKREHYDHELKPMRVPSASERLDPPLIDILVEDGYRADRSKTNTAEARFIVDEIKKICTDPKFGDRSIGVVSLLANDQALYIWKLLQNELEPEAMSRHSIACGDAKSFQGKERDIVFLSMVVTRDDARAMTQSTYAQRYNVAASRARDRMYLVRSVEIEDLSPNDHLRRQLIAHFSQPFCHDEARVEDLRKLCESEFEREVYDLLTERKYQVTPQVKVGSYRIDMVVEGHNDSRLAIECDGDRYHGSDRWDDDMNRQRILERAGWRFWRCFASTFIRHRQEMIDDLIATLREHDIEPADEKIASTSVYTAHRRVRVSEL